MTRWSAAAGGHGGTRITNLQPISNALGVPISHVYLHPDDWNGLDETAQNEYKASAEECGIELSLGDPATTNPNQVVTVSDGDFTAIDAPYYFGPAQCGQLPWEHKLREILKMEDPCFPNS